jgi:hypothetical protein
VHLPRGAIAYLNRGAGILLFRPIVLAADTDVYAEPRSDAQIVYRYGKHATLLAFAGQPDEQGWTKVRDGQGEVSYLPPDIDLAEKEVRTLRQREHAALMAKAKDRMISGGVVFALGCAVTYVTYEMAVQSFLPGTHYYTIAVGAILIGGLRFLLGFGTWLLNVGGDDREVNEGVR